ncbi:MAG: uracil-DNA glycosylase [Actinobacteria bacterium]|nr:uracil-DNA glycosylase [Actinomycetota bacterium]MCB9389831.1 uracil-DNA glycosylase [Acidimicrobiia bacterium]
MSQLDQIRKQAEACTRCDLSISRTKVVFGTGDPDAALMVIGEAPGFHEDQEGEPFVGKAGNLLTTLLSEIGLGRDDVYIANVLKCRPPNNRDPQPIEISKCEPFLSAQLDEVAPKVIMSLGNFATRYLLDTDVGISQLRGHEFLYRDGVVIPTYHPSAVLRQGGLALAQARADFVLAKAALNRSHADRAVDHAGPSQGRD